MRETNHFYFFWRHEFGQWTKREMIDPDGIAYNCCEQYMMYKKSLLFKDKQSATKIMAATEPEEHQKLGRKIVNYSNKIWKLNRYCIVWYANYLRTLLKMHFLRDCFVSSVLKSSFTPCKLRLCGRCFLALTKKLLFLEVPLKYSQHQDLRDRLLLTGDRILVEASPYDLNWGVGLSADEDRILDPKSWQGENLLGKVLMSVRIAMQSV